MSHRDGGFVPGEGEATRRAKQRIGRMLCNRWHVDSLLGMGGMASVYAATHRNGKRVALKVLHPELSADPEARRRFLVEAYAANRIGHPAAVSVLDDDVSEDGEAFLVMDLCEGETLEKKIIRHGRLTEHEVVFFADALLDVLAAAHDRGIIHRDVKPDNVFLAVDGRLRLLDFGIACVREPGRARHTGRGTALGTPAFMPPEQAFGRGEQIDGRTDLWSVGATMFTALTGQMVHEGQTDNEELLYAMTRRAPSVRDIEPDVSPELAQIVDRALAFEQDARWPDARAMQAAVRTFAEKVRVRSQSSALDAVENTPSLALITGASTPKSSKRSRSNRAVHWAGVAAVAVALGAAVTAVARSDEMRRLSTSPPPGADKNVDSVAVGRPNALSAVTSLAVATPDDRAFHDESLPSAEPAGDVPSAVRADPSKGLRPTRRYPSTRPGRTSRPTTAPVAPSADLLFGLDWVPSRAATPSVATADPLERRK